MKKLLTIVVLAFSLTAFASDYTLKIVNNTKYNVDYWMLSAYFMNSPTDYGDHYMQTDALTLGAYESHYYDDPSTDGIPFYLFASDWKHNPAGIIEDGNTVYAASGLKQVWASIKFNVYDDIYPSLMSGHIGPWEINTFQETQPYPPTNDPVYLSITWIVVGTDITVVINP